MPKKKNQVGAGMTLEGLLKDLREGFGLSQADFAEILGYDVGYVAGYETGKRHLDIPELVWIATNLDLELTSILLLYVEHREGKKRVIPKWIWDRDMDFTLKVEMV